MKADIEKRLVRLVDDILGPGDKKFHYNPKQHSYAQTVARGFCRYREDDNAAAVNMVQAATGTGKSLGYLVPAFAYAALTGERVIVSTFTLALQQQILQEDAPKAQKWVQEELNTVVKFARRVGKQNYLSHSACVDLLATLRADPSPNAAATEFLAKLIEWIATQGATLPTIEDYFSDLGQEGDYLPAGIDRASLGLNSSSPDSELEAYQRTLQATKDADLLIVNHALVMLNASRWASILDADTKPAKLLICDEADKLSDAAESVLRSDVSIHRLNVLTTQIADAYDLPAIKECVSSLHDAVMAIESGGSQMAALPPNVVTRITGTIEKLRPHVGSFAEMLESKQMTLGDHPTALIADFIDSYNSLVRVNKAASDTGNTSIISWSPVRSLPSLMVGRPDPASVITRLLASRNWDKSEDGGEVLPPRSYLNAALFTSATIATMGRSLPIAFDYFSKSIGVIRHCKAGSDRPIHNVTADLFRIYDAPEGFGEMYFVLPDPSMPVPTMSSLSGQDEVFKSNPEWLDYTATMIRKAASAGLGRTLVLTLSHDDTSALAERLEDLPGLIISRKGDSLSELKRQYKQTEGAVLITPSAWEGLDLPGDVQELVITRLPFGSMNSFQLNMLETTLAFRGYSDDKIQSIKFNMLETAARHRFTQGLGRGIRRHNDKVRVWIADPRFPFPEEFGASLDEVLMTPRARVMTPFAACIPSRFENTFKAAKLFLKSGDLYTPELI